MYSLLFSYMYCILSMLIGTFIVAQYFRHNNIIFINLCILMFSFFIFQIDYSDKDIIFKIKIINIFIKS